MNFDTDKWSLLEKAHDYRFLLRLLGLALVADLLLAATTETNLWSFRWMDVSDRPGLVLVVVLIYGIVMTVGAPAVSWVAMELSYWVVPAIQPRLHVFSNPPEMDSLRYVSWSAAEDWLAKEPDAARRAPVEKQMTAWRKDRQRWFSMVNAGWADMALVIASFGVADSTIASLSHWQWWAPWIVLLVPVFPCAYHAWAGMPGHRNIELPELAEALYRKKLARRIASRNSSGRTDER